MQTDIQYTVLNDQGATATVVNEADSRLFYKTFDGKFIPYLIEGEGGGDLSDIITVEGGLKYFNNNVYFKRSDGALRKPQLPIQPEVQIGHTVWIQCDSRTDYDSFWLCTYPLLTLDITYNGSNHIVQFEVMTQADLDTEPGGSFGFTLNIDLDDPAEININKPFNFEPGKKYMIIFQQEANDLPINIFWTELTEYAN